MTRPSEAELAAAVDKIASEAGLAATGFILLISCGDAVLQVDTYRDPEKTVELLRRRLALPTRIDLPGST